MLVTRPRKREQGEVWDTVMLRPVTDTVAVTRQPPTDLERAVQQTPVGHFANEGTEFDLVPSHTVVPYSEGHALLNSLNRRLTSLED